MCMVAASCCVLTTPADYAWPLCCCPEDLIGFSFAGDPLSFQILFQASGACEITF